MEIIFIRHGKTAGNEKKVYLGLTDESLSEKGKEIIRNNVARNIYPDCEFVYTSPLKRCIESKNIIYPHKKHMIIEDLKECDFGEYEYLTYEDLKDFPQYQNWIDSNGMAAFPKGESGSDFRKRSVNGFTQVLIHAQKNKYNKIAVVCHGGTIMSVLEKFEESQKNFYDWQIKNGEGFLTELKPKQNNGFKLKAISKII